jgi:hypothetical protein
MSDSDGADASLYTESADDVIAGLAIRGRSVTRTQLARWHRAGYVPEPIQRHQAGVRGSVSWYPTGTHAQLAAFCALHSRERNLPVVAWRMWWMGYRVPTGHARTLLSEVVTDWHRDIARLRELINASAESDEGAEALEQLLETAKVARTTRKFFRQARQRLGRERFVTFVRILLEVVTGTFEGYTVDSVTWSDTEEREIVETGMGLQRARTDRILDVQPWLPQGIGETLTTLSRQLRDHPFGEDLEAATDAELASARDELRAVLALFEGFSAMAERIFGRHAFGFGAFARQIRELPPADQARFLVLWRQLRAWGLGTAMDLLVATARQSMDVGQPAYVALQQLAGAVPEMVETVSPLRTRKAFKSQAALEQWQHELRALSAQHPDAVDAFLAQHPQIAQLLADESDKKKPTE